MRRYVTPISSIPFGLAFVAILLVLGSFWSTPRAIAPAWAHVAEQPGAPTLTRPGNSTVTSDTTPSFTWSHADGAVAYRFELSNDPSFANVLIRSEANRRSFSPVEPLTKGLTYYWCVAAVGEDGDVSWSEIWSFSIPEDVTPTVAPSRTPIQSPARKPAPTKTSVPNVVVEAAATGKLPPSAGMKLKGAGRSSGGKSPTTLVDRDLGTTWISKGSKPKNGYVYVKLDRVRQIGRIRWVFGQTGFADSMTIEISTNKRTWTRIGTRSNAAVGSWQKIDLNAKATYVRFSFTNPNGDTYVGGLAEVEVYAIESTATETPTKSRTPTKTPAVTKTPSRTSTPNPINTATQTPAPAGTATATATATVTSTATRTATVPPSQTSTSTPSPTSTQTPTSSASSTQVPTMAHTIVPAQTKSPIATLNETAIPSLASTEPSVATATSTATVVPTATPSATTVPTVVPTMTAAPSVIVTLTPTVTPAFTKTSTPTATSTTTSTPTATPTHPPVAGGLLKNPSFEQGSVNWYVDGEANVAIGSAHGGQRVMRIERGGGFTNQRLKLHPGNTYELTIWGSLTGPNEIGYAGITYEDVDGIRMPAVEPPMLQFNGAAYVEKTLTFTVPPGVSAATAFAWKSGGTTAFLVDDLYLVQQVQPVPTPGVTPATNGCQQILFPAYFYPPTGFWDPLIDDGSALAIAVLNVNSGVHTQHDWHYDAPIAKARANGVRIVGYILTGYGMRPASEVIEEMKRYREWYGVTSFFLDEADTEASSIPLYQQMTDFAHAMGGITVLNFGYKTDPGYMEIADIAIVFEDNVNVFSAYSLPSWVQNYPSHRFAEMIYGVSENQIEEVLAKTREHNIGYVFISDDHISTGSPYDTLPTYWEELNVTVSAGC